jgi:hypothetical protein
MMIINDALYIILYNINNIIIMIMIIIMINDDHDHNSNIIYFHH